MEGHIKMSPTMRRYTRLLLDLRTHAGNTSPNIPPCAFGLDEFRDELPPSLTTKTHSHSHSHPPSRTRRMVSPHPYSNPELVAPSQLQRSKSESFRPAAQCEQDITFPECAAQANLNRSASMGTRRAAQVFDPRLENYANARLDYNLVGGMVHPSLHVETEQVMLGRSNSHRPRRFQTMKENATETGGFAACLRKANETTTAFDSESLGWNPYREPLPTTNVGAADRRFAHIWENPYILALIFLPVPALLSLIYTAMGHAILRHAHPSQVAFLAPVRSSAAAGAVGGIILTLPLEFLIFLLFHSFNISSNPTAPRSAATTNNTYGRSSPFPFTSPSSPSFSEPVIRKYAPTPDNFFDDVSSICNNKSHRPHWTHLAFFIILSSLFICIGTMAAPLGIVCLDPLPLSFESAAEKALLWLLLGLDGVPRMLTPSTAAQAGMVGGAVSGLSTIFLYFLWRLTG